MSEPRGEVIRNNSVEGYAPANHSGTRNVRLVGPETNGAKNLEVVVGEIVRSEGSPPHAHPDLEQVVYVLEGEALMGIDGVEHHVGPGDAAFFPPDVFHSITAVSERVKLLVVYSPPYGEDPSKARPAGRP